eukprot:13849383-Ditylum_brightwellii.AAC.1
MLDAPFIRKGLGKEISAMVTKAANKDKCITVFEGKESAGILKRKTGKSKKKGKRQGQLVPFLTRFQPQSLEK